MSELIPGLPEPPPPPEPRIASAVILWREGARGREVFWVRRGALRFAGGFQAFPGGGLDDADGRVEVPGLGGEEAALVACATRELFEETGVLVASGTLPPRDERVRARRVLLDGALDFATFLRQHGLRVDASRFAAAGRWITPPHGPIRYDARLFLARIADGEEPEIWPGELTEGEWVRAQDAVDRWARGTVLLHPPNLWAMQCLARAAPPACLDVLRNPPALEGFVSRRVEFQRGIFVAPLRTPTLPPATHTNCWILDLGGGALALVDPGSPWPEEQARLEQILADLREEGLTPREIWLTHHHADHVRGVEALSARHGVVIRAHAQTSARVPPARPGGNPGTSEAGARCRPLSEGELLHGRWRAFHTPGHAPGHVAFLNEQTGALLAGDMVSTLSTIVIDPSDNGDMAEYLRSLERLRDAGPVTLFPAHGAPTQRAVDKLDEYLAHRREREGKVLEALSTPGTLGEITARAYDDTPAFLHPVAEKSCLASLQKLARERRAAFDGERWVGRLPERG